MRYVVIKVKVIWEKLKDGFKWVFGIGFFSIKDKIRNDDRKLFLL